MVNLEFASESKVICATAVKFSGTTAAKNEQGVFRATAMGDTEKKKKKKKKKNGDWTGPQKVQKRKVSAITCSRDRLAIK